MIATHKNPLAQTIVGILLATLLLTGCQAAYYDTMEKFGVHKRDIMVDRVEEARDAQTEAKEQFQSALEQFTVTLDYKGGDLEEKYKTLNKAYEKSKAKAEAVHSRIAKVEDVSEALFEEWEAELSQYSSDRLRQDSQAKLKKTKKHYNQLITAMKRADDLIERVLFLEGLPNLQDLDKLYIGEDVPEVLRNDLRLQSGILDRLKAAVAHCEDSQDYVSRDCLEVVLKDTEDHIDWIETQLWLIEQAGTENYLQSQM